MRLRPLIAPLVLALAVAMVGYVNAQFNVVQPAGGNLGVTGGITSVQGSVSIQNTVQVVLPTPLTIATPTYNVQAFPGATFPVSGSFSAGTVVVSNTVGIATPTYNVQAFPGATVPMTMPTTDCCQNPAIDKLFVTLASPSATTTALVAPSGSTVIRVCGFAFSEPQGVGTVSMQLLAASSTPCASATPITGAFALGVTHPGGYTVTKTAAGQSLCMKTVGAGVDPEGVVTYCQQ